MREAELRARLTAVLGADYAPTWIEQMALPDLGSRTVAQALREGVTCKEIWRAAWAWLDLPERDR